PVEGCRVDLRAGVVDEDIESAVVGDGRDEPVNVVLTCDIGLHRAAAAAEGRALGCECFRCRAAPMMIGPDLGAVPGEEARDSPADAARGACHERAAAGKETVSIRCCRCVFTPAF